MTLDEIKELAGHREVSPWVIKLVLEAVELEREACAKVCEENLMTHPIKDDVNDAYQFGVIKCAAAIRARG